MLHKLFLSISCILLQSVSFAQCNDDTKSGEATFYGGIAGSSGGNCSLPVAADDFMHCAMNNTDYENSDACGACLEVTGSRGVAVVKVVDRCPECQPGDVDLTQQAFAKVADPIDGRVPITWNYVPCPIADKSIKVNFKSGSSRFYTAIQLRDHRYAVAKLEYFENNQWVNIVRKLYNFFVAASGIATPMRLRITSVLGQQLIVDDIPIDVNNDYDTGRQFLIPNDCDRTLTNNNHTLSKKVKGFPNPTANLFYVSGGDIGAWILTNAQGSIIASGKSTTIDLSGFSKGNYFLKTNAGMLQIVKK